MVDQPSEKVIIRNFSVPKQLVWNAWTSPDLLKQWWGPKDFIVFECTVDLRVGGKYLLALKAPDSQVLWSTGTFKEIIVGQRIVMIDSFADANGTIVSPVEYGMDSTFPAELEITVIFQEINGTTRLAICYPVPESEEGQKALLKSGMNDGWEESLDKLEKLLK